MEFHENSCRGSVPEDIFHNPAAKTLRRPRAPGVRGYPCNTVMRGNGMAIGMGPCAHDPLLPVFVYVTASEKDQPKCTRHPSSRKWQHYWLQFPKQYEYGWLYPQQMTGVLFFVFLPCRRHKKCHY